MHLIAPPARDSRPAPPARSGQPWTAEDYDAAVAALRARVPTAEMAERLGRKETPMLQRLRRMLPVDERNCPAHLFLARLRELLHDPGYDWRRAMLKDSPPRPIHQPPAIVRTGVEGLEDCELVAVAYAFLRSDRPDDALMHQVRTCIVERGLFAQLERMRADALLPTAGRRLDDGDLEDSAERWLRAAPGWEDVGVPSYSHASWYSRRYEEQHSPWSPWSPVGEVDGDDRFWEREPPEEWEEPEPG